MLNNKSREVLSPEILLVILDRYRPPEPVVLIIARLEQRERRIQFLSTTANMSRRRRISRCQHNRANVLCAVEMIAVWFAGDKKARGLPAFQRVISCNGRPETGPVGHGNKRLTPSGWTLRPVSSGKSGRVFHSPLKIAGSLPCHRNNQGLRTAVGHGTGHIYL